MKIFDGIFIDMELWNLALKKPVKEKFGDGFEKAKMHVKAKKFLLENVILTLNTKSSENLVWKLLILDVWINL